MLARRYFAEPSARAELAGQIAKHPLTDIERAIRASRVFERLPSGFVKGKAPNPYAAEVQVEYFLHVPEYDPAKRYPLIMTLHGQGGQANPEPYQSVWIDEVKKDGGFFFLLPHAAQGRGSWGRSRMGYGNALGPLRDVIEKYPIDLNQIYLDGVSMGGQGSFLAPIGSRSRALRRKRRSASGGGT
ncbi:MAG: hypothetical protein HY716_12820 [Planctomycetes bacterium]|nr:hypothetical protein [Planctomycetota bacterium]